MKRPKKLRRIPRKRGKIASALIRMMDISVSIYERASTRKEKKDAISTMRKTQDAINDHLFLRIRQCMEKAQQTGSWDFMDGAFYQAVEIYAVSALAYEKYSNPLISDALFDSLAEFLLDNYERIPANCRMEYSLRREIFRAGSGMHFRDPERFPSLAAYNNRLQEIQEERKAERERVRAKNRTRLLRKAPIGRKQNRKGASRKGLSRP